MFRNTVDIYLVVFTTAIIKFVKDRLESSAKIQELESQMATVQYNAVVGNIDSSLMLDALGQFINLSDHKSKKASDIISNMSHVLDGALYKSRQKDHSIHIELELLDSYLSLVQSVYPNYTQRSYEKVIESGNICVPVMCLQKIMAHQYKELRGQLDHADIDILVLEKSDELIFQNTYTYDSAKSLDFTSTIGIVRTYFDEKSDVNILEEMGQTIVTIKIQR